jgi:hypothetical protein
MQTQTTIERSARVADSILRQLATQEQRAEKTRQRVRKLREKASAEIERLIAFMDATDGYTLDEREVEDDFEPSLGFQNMFPGRGGSAGGIEPDLELDDADDEPSLGSCTNGEHSDQSRWGRSPSDDTEDEHDGAEPDTDAEDDRADYEPSLGWTVDGLLAGTDDREEQDCSRPRPQNRTDLGTTIAVEQSYRKFVHGLTDQQRSAIRQRLHTDSGVLLR